MGAKYSIVINLQNSFSLIITFKIINNNFFNFMQIIYLISLIILLFLLLSLLTKQITKLINNNIIIISYLKNFNKEYLIQFKTIFLVNILIKNKNFLLVIKILKYILSNSQDYREISNKFKFEIYKRIAYSYKNSSDLKSSIFYYNKALLIDPDSLDILFTLALIYENINAIKESIKFLKRILKINPQNNLALLKIKSLQK
uniref:Ycf37 n=1 Tax=Cyanidium sp. THAL103 TaxID=3027999 RepID=A0A9Y1I481_9RHOD|nr:hypothetical protein CspTHAL103_158 [Cyanidium sp. THAL103]